MTNDPPRLRRAELVAAYSFFIGAIWTFATLPLDFVPGFNHWELTEVGRIPYTILGLAPIVLWFGGLIGLGIVTFRHTKKSEIQAQTGRTDRLEIEYVPGLMAAGGHGEAVLWWTTPPKLILDASRAEMPTWRGFAIWLGELRLRLVRTPDTPSRWMKFFGLQLGEVFGILYAYYIVDSSWEARGPRDPVRRARIGKILRLGAVYGVAALVLAAGIYVVADRVLYPPCACPTVPPPPPPENLSVYVALAAEGLQLTVHWNITSIVNFSIRSVQFFLTTTANRSSGPYYSNDTIEATNWTFVPLQSFYSSVTLSPFHLDPNGTIVGVSVYVNLIGWGPYPAYGSAIVEFGSTR